MPFAVHRWHPGCVHGIKWKILAHLDGLAQAALADAAQAAELEAVGRHQQVLRHGHVQVGALQLLCNATQKLSGRFQDRHHSKSRPGSHREVKMGGQLPELACLRHTAHL